MSDGLSRQRDARVGPPPLRWLQRQDGTDGGRAHGGLAQAAGSERPITPRRSGDRRPGTGSRRASRAPVLRGCDARNGRCELEPGYVSLPSAGRARDRVHATTRSEHDDCTDTAPHLPAPRPRWDRDALHALRRGGERRARAPRPPLPARPDPRLRRARPARRPPAPRGPTVRAGGRVLRRAARAPRRGGLSIGPGGRGARLELPRTAWLRAASGCRCRITRSGSCWAAATRRPSSSRRSGPRWPRSGRT